MVATFVFGGAQSRVFGSEHGRRRPTNGENSFGIPAKRTSDFERTLRRMGIGDHGIRVGDPLTSLQGVLSGSPEEIRIEGGQGDDG